MKPPKRPLSIAEDAWLEAVPREAVVRPLAVTRPHSLNSPLPRVGYAAIDAGTVARIVQARAAKAGFDPDALGGHSLKRGALAFTSYACRKCR